MACNRPKIRHALDHIAVRYLPTKKYRNSAIHDGSISAIIFNSLGSAPATSGCAYDRSECQRHRKLVHGICVGNCAADAGSGADLYSGRADTTCRAAIASTCSLLPRRDRASVKPGLIAARSATRKPQRNASSQHQVHERRRGNNLDGSPFDHRNRVCVRR